MAHILKTLLRVLNATYLSFKYLKNPLVILTVPFSEKIAVITANNEKLVIPRTKLPAVMELFQRGWTYNNGAYVKEGCKLKVTDPGILLEDFRKEYMKIPIEGKVVLDIGGFCGETSVFFIKEGGAKKVFVYEPIKDNYAFILENIKINGLKKQIIPYNLGVLDKDGYHLISSSSPPGSVRFGLAGEKHSTKIRTNSWDTILKRHLKDNIFLAKVDCEGGERYLLTADSNLIARIPHWVIEIHSEEVENAIVALFEKLRYSKDLRHRGEGKTNVWAFSRC